jgi:hypothetical protein
MRVTQIVTAAAALVTGTAGLGAAQAVPNLSGTWVLQVDQSDFGGIPGPTSRTDVIDHQEPRLTIKRTAAANGQETTTTLVYEINGQPFKNMVGASEVTSVLHWEGTTLVSVSTVQSPQGEVTITDRYSLSDDGKTLTQSRTFAVGGQSVAQTLVLTKGAGLSHGFVTVRPETVASVL